MRYIVFGVGNEVKNKYSEAFLDKVEYFVDSDQAKQGQSIRGKIVYPPEQLEKENKEDTFIIVSCLYNFYQVEKILKKYGFEKRQYVWGPDWYGNEEIPATYMFETWDEREHLVDFSLGSWDFRIETMAEMIGDDCKTIMDLGCGSMSLKRYLPNGINYIPVDHIARNEETIVCDFNRKEFPNKRADYIVASGIMEFVKDLDWFVESICNKCNCAIVSYNSINSFSNVALRHKYSWVNNYTTAQIVMKFNKNGFVLEDDRICNSEDVLLKFCKKDYCLLAEKERAIEKNYSIYELCRDWLSALIMDRDVKNYFHNNGYYNIAVYGLGELGQLFLQSIEKTDINVEYVIDRNAKMSYAEYPKILPDGEYKEVDVIVICVSYDEQLIREQISHYTDIRTVALKEVILSC